MFKNLTSMFLVILHFTCKQMSIFLLRHSCHLHACLSQIIVNPACLELFLWSTIFRRPNYLKSFFISYLNRKYYPINPILIHFSGAFCRCDWWQVLGAHAHRKAGLVAREAGVLWSTRLLHRRHRHRLQTQIQDRQRRQIRARLRRKPRRSVPWCVCKIAQKSGK